MTDETVGHMHEKVVIPPAEEINVVERNWYTGPKDSYRPYRYDGGKTIAPMAKAGDGYRFHSTGLTHDERGYPALTPEDEQEACHPPDREDRRQRRQDHPRRGGWARRRRRRGGVLRHHLAHRHPRRAGGPQGRASRWACCGSSRSGRSARRRSASWPARSKPSSFPNSITGRSSLRSSAAPRGQCKVISVNSCGGAVHDPEEILAAIKEGAK